LTPEEFTFFLYPYIAPEKFLIQAYLEKNPNPIIKSAYENSDHHSLFQKMVIEGLVVDRSSALNACWQAFISKPEYQTLFQEFRTFILKTARFFSENNE